jgi:hypothetical protein
MMPRNAMRLRKLALCAAVLACAATVLWPLAAAWAGGGGRDTGVRMRGLPWEMPAMTSYSATLEQCRPSSVPVQRSVTFAGQMVAVVGTQRMGMRIDLQERIPGEVAFHEVSAPGLGVWRSSEPGVRIYRYVKQITNLSAPAVYRAVVHFRWVGEKGRVLRRAELRTARCVQPLVSEQGTGASARAPMAG